MSNSNFEEQYDDSQIGTLLDAESHSRDISTILAQYAKAKYPKSQMHADITMAAIDILLIMKKESNYLTLEDLISDWIDMDREAIY